jgi:hypothetical protein
MPAGLYVFPALTPGSYDISVEQSGFKAKRIANIPLATGTTVTMDVQLEVGAVTESVQIEASAVQLELQTSGLSKVVETRKVVELPILGRNPLNLASIAPGVIPTSAQGGNGAGAIVRRRTRASRAAWRCRMRS